jgi:SAM-dependent methyltransferase
MPDSHAQTTAIQEISPRIDYGIDAPHISRNFSILGAIAIVVGLFLPHEGLFSYLRSPLIVWGVLSILMSTFMVLYSKIGKFKHRDRLLDQISWRGDEIVLDVGTGRGLLMIGAAKKLTTGKSFGIDIWNQEDLSNNSLDQTLNNAKLEGVSHKIQVLSEDVQKLSFADNTFDVILSNLCIHNIYNVPGRRQACLEIARVLKPGGKAIISDMRHADEYAAAFKEAGLRVERAQPLFFTTFPPLTVTTATK